MTLSTETQIQLLIRGQQEQAIELAEVKERAEQALAKATDRIAALEDERNKALRWGVMSLGTAVLVMGGWIMAKLFTGGIKW